MRKLILLLFIPLVSFSQINEQSKLNWKDLDRVLVFPGCKGDNNEELRKCSYEKFSNFVIDNFNWRDDLGLRGLVKLRVFLKVDTMGNIYDFRLKSNIAEINKQEKINKRVERMLRKVPSFEPAIKDGKKIERRLNFPINIKIK